MHFGRFDGTHRKEYLNGRDRKERNQPLEDTNIERWHDESAVTE